MGKTVFLVETGQDITCVEPHRGAYAMATAVVTRNDGTFNVLILTQMKNRSGTRTLRKVNAADYQSGVLQRICLSCWDDH